MVPASTPHFGGTKRSLCALWDSHAASEAFRSFRLAVQHSLGHCAPPPRQAPGAHYLLAQVILEDWVYDLEKFAAVHPGGATAVKLFGGSNATAHYYMLHQHKEIRLKLLAPFRLRPAGAPVGPSAREGDPAFILNSPAYQDLKTRVRKAIPNQVPTLFPPQRAGRRWCPAAAC